jgi:hypothetical protein
VKTLLFARNLQHATVDYLQHLAPDDRRNVIVITDQQDEFKVRGLRKVAFCFLDGWWLDWSPIAAYEAYNIWPKFFDATRVWEVHDTLRSSWARQEIGLEEGGYSQFERYEPEGTPTVSIRWRDSLFAHAFDYLIGQGGEGLPGLDDKKDSHNPVGGIVFSEIFDIEDPDSTYPLYADWFIRRNIRQPDIYIKEPKRDRDNISAALDCFRGVPAPL